jgi:hypothetical protein
MKAYFEVPSHRIYLEIHTATNQTLVFLIGGFQNALLEQRVKTRSTP